MPSLFLKGLLAENSLIVLDHLKEAGQYGDAFVWREAISALERDWFAPLLAYLRWHPSRIRLVDPVHGHELAVNGLDYWKIWKRPRPLLQLLKR